MRHPRLRTASRSSRFLREPIPTAPDGSVWYTAQNTGRLGRLDPATGEVVEIPLGEGSAPHGVIVGPDGAAWITDGGLNAIVRVFPVTPDLAPADNEITVYPLPRPANANLNTAAFDGEGILWFTGQAGVYGSVDPDSGVVTVYDAPRGPGPYGIDSTPDGDVWFVSLAGSYLARIDASTAEADVIDLLTPGQGARRVWSDSHGRLWISEWNAGQLSAYDPTVDRTNEWPLPGNNPMAYAVYVDELDLVWVTDFGSNSLVRFDPSTETFESFPLPTAQAAVRQLLGREGELWGAESAVDKIFVLRRSD
jgi:virginiamycin B lyase